MDFIVFTGTLEVAWKRPQAIVLARNGSYSLKASWVHREDTWLTSQSLPLALERVKPSWPWVQETTPTWDSC